MKRITKLTLGRETIALLSGAQLGRAQGGAGCRTHWWEASCVPDMGSLQCTHNQLGCSGSGCTEVC